MRTVAHSYIQAHLRKGIAALCPPEPEGLGQFPVEKARGDEWYLDGTQPRKRESVRLVRLGAAVAACMFLFCAAAVYLTGQRVDARIFLDVNPSIELRINSRERVIEAKALNEDGEIALDGMQLKDTPLDVAVNAILGSTVKHGYLSQAQDWILLSVEGRDREKAEALRTRLTQGTQEYMVSLVGAGNIWNQSFSIDSAIEETAAQYGISPGKAALLTKLEAREPGLDLGLLSKLSISELEEYLRSKGINPEDIISHASGSTGVKKVQTPSPEPSPRTASPSQRPDTALVPRNGSSSPQPETGSDRPNSPARKPTALPATSKGPEADGDEDDENDGDDRDDRDDMEDEDSGSDDHEEDNGPADWDDDAHDDEGDQDTDDNDAEDKEDSDGLEDADNLGDEEDDE